MIAELFDLSLRVLALLQHQVANLRGELGLLHNAANLIHATFRALLIITNIDQLLGRGFHTWAARLLLARCFKILHLVEAD